MQSQQTGVSLIHIMLGIVVVTIISLFAYNLVNRPPNKHIGKGEPWQSAMSQGSHTAPNVFVDYTDYFCSFCAQVEAATNTADFQQYIKSGKLRYEHRIVAVLKDIVPNTERGAEAAFCAADQHKYWEYTHHIVPRIKADYFDKGIGVKGVAVPKEIPLLPVSYFEASAEAIGLNVETFRNCVTNEKHKDDIATNTSRALKLGVTGLPYMIVNDYTTSGFGGGEHGLKTLLKAGGVH